MDATRADPITLNFSAMNEVVDEYDIRSRIIKPLVKECKKSGSGWLGRVSSTGLNAGRYYSYYTYSYRDARWGAALGGVRFTTSSSCNPVNKTLIWSISIKDSWDFDNWRSGVTNLPRNIITMLVKAPNVVLDCRWKRFDHKGWTAGTETW